MIFWIGERQYSGTSAVQIVRAIEHDDNEYCNHGGPIRDYMTFYLNRLTVRVSARDLDLSDRLEDETLARSYLLLLDEYGLGEFVDQTVNEGVTA